MHGFCGALNVEQIKCSLQLYQIDKRPRAAAHYSCTCTARNNHIHACRRIMILWPVEQLWICTSDTINFVDPTTGAYTQSIESIPGHTNAKYKRMHGTSSDLFPSYLIEFMWRKKHGKRTPFARFIY